MELYVDDPTQTQAGGQTGWTSRVTERALQWSQKKGFHKTKVHNSSPEAPQQGGPKTGNGNMATLEPEEKPS